MQPAVGESIAWAVRGPAGRINFPVRFDHGSVAVGFSNAKLEVANEFLQRGELFFRGALLIEVAHQTNAQGNVVEVVTVDMAAVELLFPTRPDFDFAVPGGGAVADHKMIGKTVGHFSNIGVIEIKRPGVALFGAAVVNDDVAPAGSSDRRGVNGLTHRACEKFPAGKPSIKRNTLKGAPLIEARLFNDNKVLSALWGGLAFGCRRRAFDAWLL